MSQNVDTKVITGEVRLSYAHLFEPAAAQEGGEKKYSVSLLIPKNDKSTLNKIKKAVDAATQAGKPKFGGKIPANLKSPLRDGDEDRPDDENYAGHYFLNASSKNRPGIIGRDKQPVTNSEDVYSGCFAYASLNFFAYNTAGNKGVGCGLNNIMKVRDGDYLGGRSRAEDDFAEVELEDGDDDFMN